MAKKRFWSDSQFLFIKSKYNIIVGNGILIHVYKISFEFVLY